MTNYSVWPRVSGYSPCQALRGLFDRNAQYLLRCFSWTVLFIFWVTNEIHDTLKKYEGQFCFNEERFYLQFFIAFLIYILLWPKGVRQKWIIRMAMGRCHLSLTRTFLSYIKVSPVCGVICHCCNMFIRVKLLHYNTNRGILIYKKYFAQ